MKCIYNDGVIGWAQSQTGNGRGADSNKIIFSMN